MSALVPLLVPLLVAVGAGLGAGVRYLVTSRWDRHAGAHGGAARAWPWGTLAWPWGTLAVNVVGSGLAGAVVAALVAGGEGGGGGGGRPAALLVAGLCGGLTTWSGFAVQVHDLGWRRGAPYAVTVLLLSLGACAACHAIVAAQA